MALAGSGCAVINDTIYVVGGRDSAGNRYRTLFTYDPVNDQWDSLAQMSIARGHVVAAAVNDALKKSKDMVTEEVSKITGGMGLPGLP